MELIDYFLEPAIPFGLVIWGLWAIFRDDIRDSFSDD
jgi:hypothetical protein